MAQLPTSPNAEPAHFLDIPGERRAAAKAHVALIAASVRTLALALPLAADADDFRRVLVEGAPK